MTSNFEEIDIIMENAFCDALDHHYFLFMTQKMMTVLTSFD